MTCLNDGSNLLGKEANYLMKFLKAVLIVAIATGALSLGACAKKETMSTSTGSTSSTYSK